MVRQNRFDLAVFAALAAVMLVTRTHSLSNVMHLPDTSLASFFALGYLVRNRTAFAGLLGLAFAIDVVVIYGMGGSGFCFTPAYAMLLPAYGVMWAAGRFAARNLPFTARAIAPAALLVVAATLVSELMSSGGFYFLGGRFDAPTLAGFAPRLLRYFPPTLFATLVWTAAAAALVALVPALRPATRAAAR